MSPIGGRLCRLSLRLNTAMRRQFPGHVELEYVK